MFIMTPAVILYRTAVNVNRSPWYVKDKSIIDMTTLRDSVLWNQEARHQFKRIVKCSWLCKSNLTVDQNPRQSVNRNVLV